MKKGIKVLLAVLAALCLAVACLWFIPAAPGLWYKQTPSTGNTGDFEKNEALSPVSLLSLGGDTRPETVLCRDGYLYMGVKGGALLRMHEDGGEPTTLLKTGGCLLGLAFDNTGNLLVADCDYHGTGAILKVDAATGESAVLVSRDTGTTLYYPNAIAVAPDGTVYFTDSTTVFPPSKYGGDSYAAAVNEALMHTATGRVLAWSPADGSVRVVAKDLDFANGIALSADGTSLFVSETYVYCVKKIDIATGAVSPFLDNLPGYPDNLTAGLDGRYWVGLANQRSASLDGISDQPLLRKCVWLYGKLFPAAEESSGGYASVFAFTEDGTIAECLQSGTNGYYKTTGATETETRLYLQSVNENGTLAYLPRENAVG